MEGKHLVIPWRRGGWRLWRLEWKERMTRWRRQGKAMRLKLRPESLGRRARKLYLLYLSLAKEVGRQVRQGREQPQSDCWRELQRYEQAHWQRKQQRVSMTNW